MAWSAYACGIRRIYDLYIHEIKGENKVYCQRCGSMYDDRQQVCPYCGMPRPSVNNSQFHGLQPPVNSENGMPAYDTSNTPPETGLLLLSFFVPFWGVIIGLICLGNNERRAGRAYLLMAALRYVCIVLIVLAVVFRVYSFFSFFL